MRKEEFKKIEDIAIHNMITFDDVVKYKNATMRLPGVGCCELFNSGVAVDAVIRLTFACDEKNISMEQFCIMSSKEKIENFGIRCLHNVEGA